ncbi:DUF4169 family protein [Tianweitania sediminis]|jgi:hypothetical protein|uniref:DUF4169 family protein n=1 Tax=Tianweitania sediminis TaxID=1502156 RepID=A0A8J7R6Y8_9HYPH|nr:DUF4169 family protein [Tianweitania sediminis]MBP0439167.1 DUF4169 family protein [Tianweitania sediminis]
MGDLVNLRSVRKQRARIEAERQAEENRQRFGRTKAEKTQQEQAEARQSSLLDGHHRGDRKPS